MPVGMEKPWQPCNCGWGKVPAGGGILNGDIVHRDTQPCYGMAEQAVEIITIDNYNLKESNLLRHAETELKRLGMGDRENQILIDMMKVFVSYGHSGGSASWFIATFVRLAQFENLSPLTSNPDEWQIVDWADPNNRCWQSKRNAEAFSLDKGRTYYLLSEGATQMDPRPLHESEPKAQQQLGL